MLRQAVLYFSLVAASYLAIFGFQASAAMSSTNYQILWDSVGVGGSDVAVSSGGTYMLRDVIGGTADGSISSASYSISAGYRAGIYDPVVKIVYYVQDKNSQVGTTLLVGTTVTVTTAGDFSVGDYAVVVQDDGASQVAAFGQVASTTATTITVDARTDGGTAPVIDGSGDFVYELSGTSLAFGSLTSSTVATGIIAWEATADVNQGYGVYVVDSGEPRSLSADTLTDVVDGAVTAGSSEYGGRSSDVSLATSTFDTADTGFTTTPQLVASRSDATFSERDFLTVKAAVSSTQAAGSYSGTVTLILAGDY